MLAPQTLDHNIDDLFQRFHPLCQCDFPLLKRLIGQSQDLFQCGIQQSHFVLRIGAEAQLFFV